MNAPMLSFKYRIALVIFVLEALMMSVVLWQTLTLSTNSARELHAANENVLIDLVNEVASTALLTDEYTDLQLYLEKLAQQPTVRHILISDISERVVASSSPRDIGRAMPPIEDTETDFWRRHLIHSPAGTLGSLAVQFSTEALEEATAHALQRGAIIAGIGMALIAVVGVVVGFALTRRLDQITSTAKHFVEGDASARSGVRGHDELGTLGETFDDMIERVVGQKAELERQVAQRTTALKQAAEIIDQVHEAVVATDLDGVVTDWNGGAERLFGYRADQAIGRPIDFVYPEDQHAFLRDEVIAPLKVKGSHEVEVCMVRKDGAPFHAHLSLSMLRDESGLPKGMVGFSTDISDRKTREQQLQDLTAHLAEANRELEAFSYSVSHDLRAPLRAIDGFSQALLEDYAEKLDGVGKTYLQRVRGGAQHMAKLIDDLLQLSRVSRRDISYERVDLSALGRDAVRELAEGEPDRRVEVHIADGLVASGDEVLLRVALQNLIGNAWKYTSRTDGARIWFELDHHNSEPVFVVRDNGAGFDMRYAGKLFGTFQRLHHNDEFPGTGVGLATVQRIIRRHGGRIWADAEVGKGARFYFSLPSRVELDAVTPDSQVAVS